MIAKLPKSGTSGCSKVKRYSAHSSYSTVKSAQAIAVLMTLPMPQDSGPGSSLGILRPEEMPLIVREQPQGAVVKRRSLLQIANLVGVGERCRIASPMLHSDIIHEQSCHGELVPLEESSPYLHVVWCSSCGNRVQVRARFPIGSDLCFQGCELIVVSAHAWPRFEMNVYRFIGFCPSLADVRRATLNMGDDRRGNRSLAPLAIATTSIVACICPVPATTDKIKPIWTEPAASSPESTQRALSKQLPRRAEPSVLHW